MSEDQDVQPGMHFMLRCKADAIWYLEHAKPHDCLPALAGPLKPQGLTSFATDVLSGGENKKYR